MRHPRTTLAAIAVCALAVAGAIVGLGTTATAHRTPRAVSARTATVSLRSTRLGRILATGSGQTLYEFTRDHGDRDTCVTVSGCAAAWPPLEVSGSPTAGSGVRGSLLSSIRIAGGKRQVTYAGHPLYLYANGYGAGETSYVGASSFGGTWYALSASGATVK